MSSKRNKNVNPELEQELEEQVDVETEETEETDNINVETEDTEETNGSDVETEETTEEEPKQQEEPESAMHKGLVINCMKLNVRKGPGKEFPVVETIMVGKKVVVKDVHDDEWFKIPGKGYVMKKFISIGQ